MVGGYVRPRPVRTMRRSLIPALAALLAAGFITLSVATTVWQQDRLHSVERSQLASEARDQHQVLDDYFARSASLTQLLAQNPAFRDFYRLPGTRLERVRQNSAAVREANAGLAYVEELFPGRI